MAGGIEFHSKFGLRFEFCSVTTLRPDIRQYIRDHMTWDYGSMRGWLSRRSRHRRMCLIFNGKLITWSCLGINHDISAWTLSSHRNRGYAQAAMWALLDHESISFRRKLWTYSPVTRRIVRRLGYKVT